MITPSPPALPPAKAIAAEPIESLAAALIAGDRRALARAITLVESTRSEDIAPADALLKRLVPVSGESLRLGITGIPGVGKSTFIERFGLDLAEAGHRLAVLAIDPSSTRTGGSILADKTRMELLSRHPKVFIRPSPSQGTLGGVARRTGEAIILAEAAGFEIIIIETVGVGQSETEVAALVDLFCLLLMPGSGDELQGIKKGIVELADLVIVNKADGDLAAAAMRAVGDYRAALSLLRAREAAVPVFSASALSGAGLSDIWQAITLMAAERRRSGAFEARRAGQAVQLFNRTVADLWQAQMFADPGRQEMHQSLSAAVAARRLTPYQAAEQFLTAYDHKD